MCKSKSELAWRAVDLMQDSCPLHRLVHLSKPLTVESTIQRVICKLGYILGASLTDKVEKDRQSESRRLAKGSWSHLLTEVREPRYTRPLTATS